jgi:EmrB/QacA subfamily drug resistance transporter
MAAIAYVTAVGITAVDMQIVNVALPSIGRGFGASLSDLQWIAIGYALALAVVMPASGWIGDRFGTKRTFLAALLGFTFSSALCGISPGLVELVIARIIQGLAGGLLTSAGTALLYRAFPVERRARVARLVIVPIILGPATAPVVGGALTDALSWRWVFLVNVPIGLVLAAVIARHLEEYRGDVREPLDLPSLLGSALWLTALLYALSEGATLGWGSPSIVAAAAVGVVTLVWFVRRQLRSRYPVLDLRLLSDRLFRAGVVTIGFSSGCFLGILYLVPIFLQEVDRLSPLASALSTFPEAVGVFIASQTLARFYPRLGPRVMASAGAAGVAAILAWMTLSGADTSLSLIRVQMFLLGAMNSAVFLSVQSSVFTNISHERTGHASAIFVTQRQGAIAVGTALLTSVVNAVHGSPLHRFHAGFLAATLLAVVAAVAAFTLMRTQDAISSMRRGTTEPADAAG